MKKVYKQKILMVHNYYQVPGGEDSVFDNEKKLLEINGHDIKEYTKNNEEIESYNLVQKFFYPLNAIFSFKTYREVKKKIAEEQIDIVHIHNTWPLISPSVYYAAFRLDIPVVQTVHNFRLICPSGTLYHEGEIFEDSLYKGLLSAIQNKVYKDSYTHTTISALSLKIHRILKTYKKVNFIFLTKFNRDKVLELNSNSIVFNESNTYIKPNFVIEDRKVIPYEKRKQQFVYVGRLDKTKGIELLLHTWKDIKDYKLVICGTGPEKDFCIDFIEKNHISNIEILGFVEHKSVLNIISESLALILPSQLYEGFPMTIVESFSCGTPVIGSNIGNINDLIEDGVTGYKFQFNSEKSLKEAVYNVSNMTRECKRIFREKYRADINYKQLMDIYENIQRKMER